MKKLYLLLLVFVGLTCFPQLAKSQSKNIDCGCTPAEVQGWTLISAKGDGACVSDPMNIKLISFESKTSMTKGSEIVAKMKDTGLNSCVFDHLMAHQELIPESWKGKQIAFPGTIYADGLGNKFFRYMHWWEGKWHPGYVYVESEYDDKVVAIK